MGFFSTVHAYTNTQALTDQPMKDRRDSWAAAENIIPSSSGAAKALKFIWPDLNITGKAYRVPMRTGSIVELNVLLGRDTTAAGSQRRVPQGRRAGPAARASWACSKTSGPPAASWARPHSSLIDLPLTQVLGGRLLTVAAWYDNEMGYASRLAEMAAAIAE